jgi:ketosteroid isomerase-like protein
MLRCTSFLFLLLATAAFARDEAYPEIGAFNQRFTEAIRHMDNAATVALWSEDGVSLLPEMAPIRGRGAIEKFLTEVTSKLSGYKVLAHDNDWHDLRVSGDWASEWAETRQQVQPPEGKPPITITGKMLLVLHREKSDWKIVAESWTSEPKR